MLSPNARAWKGRIFSTAVRQKNGKKGALDKYIKSEPPNFAIGCEHESTANIFLDMLDNELTIPLKRMGLLDMYNGLDVMQTKGFIKITCTTYIECISAKHLASWMKNLMFQLAVLHPFWAEKALCRVS
jgi:hypothetical protein